MQETQTFLFGVRIPDQSLFQLMDGSELEQTEPDMTPEERLQATRDCWVEYAQTDNGWVRAEDENGTDEETYVSTSLKEYERHGNITERASLYRLPHSLDERLPFIVGLPFKLFSRGRMLLRAVVQAERGFGKQLPQVNRKSAAFTHCFLRTADLQLWLHQLAPSVCQLICDYLHERPRVYLYQSHCGCCS